MPGLPRPRPRGRRGSVAGPACRRCPGWRPRGPPACSAAARPGLRRERGRRPGRLTHGQRGGRAPERPRGRRRSDRSERGERPGVSAVWGRPGGGRLVDGLAAAASSTRRARPRWSPRRSAERSPERARAESSAGVGTGLRGWGDSPGTRRIDVGSTTEAVTPPRVLRSSSTKMPCRFASRLTTSRPIRRAVSALISPPERSSSLSAAMASSFIPRPASLTLMTTPSGGLLGRDGDHRLRRRVRQRVVDELGDQVHRVRGRDAGDRSVASASIWTRWYSWTPASAACRTSLTLRPWVAGRGRRVREHVERVRRTPHAEARWSSRKRLSSRFGSSSSFSRVSIRPSCWLIREVLRRERVTNISPTCPRSLASPAARLTASWCRPSTARASWPISSCVVTSMGTISPGSPPARMIRTASAAARGPPPARPRAPGGSGRAAAARPAAPGGSRRAARPA